MLKTIIVFLCLVVSFCSVSQEKIVHDLKIQGNKKLKTSFIKKISSIKQGVALDSLVIEQDILRLKRLPSVSYAYYQVFKSEGNQYNVFYNIEENFTLIPSLNIYTTNDDEFAFRIGLQEFNLFGRNIALGGFYQKDVYSSVALNFRAPYLFSNRFGLAVNIQDLTTQEPIFFDDATEDYRYDNDSFEVLGLYKINFKNRVELGLNYFTEAYNIIGDNINNRPEIKVNKWLTKFIYEYNSLDYFYQYISGFRSQFNFQYVTSGNEEILDFFIGWNDFFYFKRIGKRGNWANRLRMGLSTNNKTPFAPFSVDNNINLRGVGNVIDRGTGVVVLNTEYRHTFCEKEWFVLQGNAFIDSGTWRNPGGDFRDFSRSKNMRVYPGLGLRFTHKKIFNAIFRIDYGIGITPGATQGLVFGIGQYF